MNAPRKKRFAAACIVFTLLFIAACLFISGPLIRFVREPSRFRTWVAQSGLWGKIAFVGMMALQVFFAFIPGEPLEIGAGYAFGAWEGTLLCLIGAALGATAVFLFVKKWGIKAVELFFPKEKIRPLRFLQDEKRLYFLSFLIFFIPGTPKDILSYCVALTRMKLLPWLLISSVARIPSVVTSTVGGDALGVGNTAFAVIVFVVTLMVSLAGFLLYQAICRKRSAKTADD